MLTYMNMYMKTDENEKLTEMKLDLILYVLSWLIRVVKSDISDLRFTHVAQLT